MQPKTIAIGKQKATHQDLGFGVFALDMRHATATLLLRQYICHIKKRNFPVGRQATKPLYDYKEVLNMLV